MENDMNKIEFNALSKIEFLKLAISSVQDVKTFSQFVCYSELLCEDGRDIVSEKNKIKYNDLWFRLEIINAVALDKWEQEEEPLDWANKWESQYKTDAKEVIQKLIILLTS
jgi:hypothetical protein